MIQIKQNGSYKIGVDEIPGLKGMMARVLEPVRAALAGDIYWSDMEFSEAEYKSRDGFIANRDNLGGLMLEVVIPKCEEYNFEFLEFGTCDECDGEKQCGGDYCAYEGDGHLDAKLRIWLKLEHVSEDELRFWLYAGGGNGDAPYFRTKYEVTIFEAEFSAKSVFSVPTEAKKHVAALLLALGYNKKR